MPSICSEEMEGVIEAKLSVKIKDIVVIFLSPDSQVTEAWDTVIFIRY